MGFDITSRGTSPMGYELVFFLEDRIAPIAIHRRMTFVDVGPWIRLVCIEFKNEGYLLDTMDFVKPWTLGTFPKVTILSLDTVSALIALIIRTCPISATLRCRTSFDLFLLRGF